MSIYNLLLKFVYPPGLCLVLLLVAACARRRKVIGPACLWSAIGVLFLGGNEWLASSLAKSLEWRFLSPDPLPEAQCILVLGGGVVSQAYPRQTRELAEEGDRVFYAAHLYRMGKARIVVCTGGIVPGSARETPNAEDMAAVLRVLGVPAEAIVVETTSRNTYEHTRNVGPLLKEREFRRVLLVTSALHMPRALGVFKRQCPGTEFIPAPTDFSQTAPKPRSFIKEVAAVIPSAESLRLMGNALHEYIGIAYYKCRGWM